MHDRTDETDRAEDVQAAIRESIERARELLCEARMVFRQEEASSAEPPLSTH